MLLFLTSSINRGPRFARFGGTAVTIAAGLLAGHLPEYEWQSHE